MPRPNNVGVGVAIIVHNDIGQILLGLRQGAHAAGLWSTPGGWIDFEDTSTELTCQRELLEEIGIHFNTDQIKQLRSTIEQHEDLNITCITIYHSALYIKTAKEEIRLMEPHKCKEWKWFYPSELPKNLFPNLKNQLELFNS